MVKADTNPVRVRRRPLDLQRESEEDEKYRTWLIGPPASYARMASTLGSRMSHISALLSSPATIGLIHDKSQSPAVAMCEDEWGAHEILLTQASWLDRVATGTHGERMSSRMTAESSMRIVYEVKRSLALRKHTVR